MSAEFHTRLEDTVFRVKIDRDGTMTILDPPVEMEYEIAYTAMGGKRSLPLRLQDTWDRDPITTITHHLTGFSNNDLNLLALDWAEHVLPIYTNTFTAINPVTTSRVTALLRRSRNSIAGGGTISKKDQEVASKCSTATADWADIGDKTASDVESMKAWAAWYAIAALSMAIHGDSRRCADRAATAFARRDGCLRRSSGGVSPAVEAEIDAEFSEEFEAEYLKEQAWQVRRFVAVMTALQTGKNRPPLGATT
jgi:hypothetical protein